MLISNPPKKQRAWLADIVCLTFLFTLFYFLWLGSYPLFTPDEGRYSEVAREMLATHQYITPRVNGIVFLDKPILYYWLQAIAIALFGIKEWAIRFFPALLGIAGCLMTYAAGYTLFDRRTGLIAAILLATSPLYFIGAHYADLNSEVAVFISCSLLSFIMGVKKKSHLLLFAAYFFAALAALTKGLIGLAFPGLIIVTWITLQWRFSLFKSIHLCSGLLFFFALTVPWYLAAQHANPSFLQYFFVTQQVSRFLSEQTFNNPTPIWFYIPVILLGFYPWTIFLFQTLTTHIKTCITSTRKHNTTLFLLLWFFIVFIFFSVPHSKTIGYIFPVFPPLALLTAHYLTQQHTLSKFCVLSFLILNVLFAVALLVMLQHTWLPTSFNAYLIMLGLFFIISGFLAIILRYQLSTFIVFCAIFNILFLLTIVHGARHLNPQSTKMLALTLRSRLQPSDEVVNYYHYYQDLPLYLNRNVYIVYDWQNKAIQQKDNWARELWDGLALEPASPWFIDNAGFLQHWNSNKQVYVFLGTNYYDEFTKLVKHARFVATENNILLLSNR